MTNTAEVVLMFSAYDPCNCTITDAETTETLYVVETRHNDTKTVTYVSDGDGMHLASLEWREIRSDIVTLGSAPSFSQRSWLRKSLIPMNDTVYLRHNGIDYKWKGNAPGLSLQLYNSSDKKTPIARFHKPKRNATLQLSPAALVLDSRGAEVMDVAVISFLFLEKTRKMQENSRAADSWAVGGGGIPANFTGNPGVR